MENDIKPIDGVNISEIGKYDKFINFTPLPEEYKDKSLFPDKKPFEFYTNEMKKDKLSESERFLSMERMQENLQKLIEEKLKQNRKLQNKIKEIQDKAKKKIDKLKEKPMNKLKKEYGYERFEEYFEPKVKLDSLEDSPSVSSTSE